MNLFIETVIGSCKEVRDFITNSSNSTLFDSFDQGHGGDISHGFDLYAEKIFFKNLSPFGSIFSEESGWMSPRGSRNIILDPIDGSDNFSSSFPYYGISVALEVDGSTTEAVVCNLANGDVFVRTCDEYYRTTIDKSNEKASINHNGKAKVGLFEKAPEHPVLGEKLMHNKLKYRSPGALALSLAYAPYVKYVLFLGTMRSFDIQAGLYLSQHLYGFQDERYILLSSDKEVFERIRLIVEKEYF
ncbi:MAG: inositol monophosphatase family protein [Sulfuricurvum sp.]|nr:inositol monophosphatase family protein [Sulfuricurvum sp.]MDP3023719.1 inositol monophosphatase family protein [Sulfuricurvum sp.]MDP3119051.1 inositol monophosphatase family protein [Sulfuricurvum sp.]